MPTELDEVTVEAVEEALVTLVRHVSSGRTWRRLAAATGVDVDRARYLALRAVDDLGRARTGELADHVGVDQSTMSRHLAELERQRLVERVPDPDDRRASFVSATPAGREVIARVRSARHGVLGAVIEEWSPEDRAALAPLLSRLAADFARLEPVT